MTDKRNSAACHKMVREVAISMAHETYDSFMQNNVYYENWRKENPGLERKAYELVWVNRNWSRFIPAARATMGAMLAQPLDEGLKEQISEALILDATLIRGRVNPSQILGSKT